MKTLSQFLKSFYQNHRLYFVILSYFLFLDLLVFGMGLFIYQKEAAGARQEMRSKLLAEQEKHAERLQEQYQALYSLGQNLLNHFYIQRNLVLYEEATSEERIQMINIPSILASGKDQWDGIDEIFLYMNSAKGYTQDGMEQDRCITIDYISTTNIRIPPGRICFRRYFRSGRYLPVWLPVRILPGSRSGCCRLSPAAMFGGNVPFWLSMWI